MRPKYGLPGRIFTATPRPLLNMSNRLVSALIKVHTGGALFCTTISYELAAPRWKVGVPAVREPRSCVLAPPSKITVTLSADSFRMNDTTPAFTFTPDAYGVARTAALRNKR